MGGSEDKDDVVVVEVVLRERNTIFNFHSDGEESDIVGSIREFISPDRFEIFSCLGVLNCYIDLLYGAYLPNNQLYQ